jgi:threonine synthase
VTLRCFACDRHHDPTRLQTVCEGCGLPIRVSVDLSDLRPESAIDRSVESMWRYSALLAVPFEARVSLGEGWTPIIEVEENVFVKDESVSPTGSFKDRGISMAVSAAVLLGAGRLVAPSAGNAAVALSAYGREAGAEVLVAMPDDTPQTIIDRCRDYGSDIHLVDGDISIAGKWLAANRADGDFDLSTLKEPYRVEGKKTMGYEIWEQFGGKLPDVVLYPTGGGTGLVGMWKAWDEMEEMGWIGGERPRLFSVQSAGCAPIVKAFEAGATDIQPWPDPVTTAWGLRVPSPIAGFLCLRAIRETGGGAVAIDEAEIHQTAEVVSARTGIDFCPEGGAAWAAMELLRDRSEIVAGEKVLVWNTGSGKSYE